MRRRRGLRLPGLYGEGESLASTLEGLSDLLATGVSLGQALTVVGNNLPEGKTKGAFLDIAGRVIQGEDFAESLKKHRCFSRVVLDVLTTGYREGNLSEACRIAADWLRKEGSIKRKAMEKLAAPLLMLTWSLVLAVTVCLYVLPRFTGAGKASPSAELLKAVSIGMGLVVSLVIGLVVFLKILSRVDTALVDRITARLPIVGRFRALKGYYLSLFALGGLLKQGTRFDMAVESAAETASFGPVREELREVARRVRAGEDPFAGLKHLGGEELTMLRLAFGEERLTKAVEHAARRVRDRIEIQTEMTVRLLTAGLVALVGFLMASVLLAVGLTYLDAIP
ncbi:TPA: hypothetical protein EYP38_02520 [Candidatus Micrarchaeota archaeon]|nr:hypothetical protein [Candidatus Micrarchaeota archaeon]